jgi:cystathionine gamma-synthase
MEDDAQYGAVAPPVHLSSTFSFAAPGEPRLHDYTRSGNPTRDLLAEAMAELERGAGATITASGMGAIAVALQLVAPGGRLVAPADCYGGTWRLIDALARRGALEVEWVRFDRPGEWRRALARPADTVWLESPSNPLLRVCDVASIAASAKAGGARVVVDNTFLSPVLMQPLALGADLVVHSTTKYINGHSDVLGGAIIAAEPGTAEHCAWWANCLGITAGAFDSWMTLRGLRTLDVRMQRHVANARAVAELLAAHPAVAKVFYPGLANDPGHRIAAGQQRAPGGIVSFELAGGYEAVRRCLAGLRWFTLAESLGGTESLVAHPATMTHAAMSAAARERAGIGPGLLRLSVGIEDCDDLLDDLRKGLDRARASDGLESRAGAGG